MKGAVRIWRDVNQNSELFFHAFGQMSLLHFSQLFQFSCFRYLKILFLIVFLKTNRSEGGPRTAYWLPGRVGTGVLRRYFVSWARAPPPSVGLALASCRALPCSAALVFSHLDEGPLFAEAFWCWPG